MRFTEAIKEILNKAVADSFPASGAAFESQVTPCQDRKFGDYQSNLAFQLAKREKTSPRHIAETVVRAVQAGMAQTGTEAAGAAPTRAHALLETIEIAGPGFINVRVRDSALLAELEGALADPRCGVERVARPQRIVVDYSSPNLAKDLHVGAMRSTVIGDSIARVLEFLGHDVMRQNHYGDWGANFGVLVAMIKQEYGADLDELRAAPLEAVEELYAKGSSLKATSAEFAARAAAEVNNLQAGNPESLAVWQVLKDKTLRNCHELYRTFNVSLDASHDCPESFYRDELPGVIRELSEQNLLVDDNQARCVYLEGFYNVDGDPLPVIVQKSDEGYNYSTTELAGIRRRVDELRAQQIIIVTDRGQELHFRMIRALAQKAGWLPAGVRLRHLAYGVILHEVTEAGQTRKTRFRTRRGGTVKIRELLAEGSRRSREFSRQGLWQEWGAAQDPTPGAAPAGATGPDATGVMSADTAEKLAIAALKYADLKQRPESDYTFNWEQMLASQGNTGIYILYCYVRIASLFRKSGLDAAALAQNPHPVAVSHELERALLMQLVSFPELFSGYEEELSSHAICSYLYELSSLYSRFWRDCRVLDAADEVRHSRLVLSLAVARRLKLGLALLGIDVVEKM